MENKFRENNFMKENSIIIKDFIKLKGEHSRLYYKYQQTIAENENLKIELDKLKAEKVMNDKELIELRTASESRKNESGLKRENNLLQAKLKQVQRNSSPRTPVVITRRQAECLNKNNNEYEVEKLLKHRKRNKKLQFLVRWKHFSSCHDSWEKEENLECPEILNEYMKENNVQ